MEAASVEALKRFSPDRYQKCSVFQTERLYFDVYCLEPGQEQKVHSHEGSDKVYYVLEGRPTFQVGAERQQLGPGHAVLAPAGVEHGVRNETSDRLSLLVFMSPPPQH